jgi:hypothetical protein
MPTILAALVVFASVENENQLVPEVRLEPSRGLTPPDFESSLYIHNSLNIRVIL